MVEYSQSRHPKYSKNFFKTMFHIILYTLCTKSYIIFIKINAKHFYDNIILTMIN